MEESGRAMNPYELTLPNMLARMNAWVRCLLWQYRRPLLVTAMAAATLALGVNAAQTSHPQRPAPISGH